MMNRQRFSRLHKILDEAAVYARTIGKLSFDMSCCAPEEGMEQAGQDMAEIGRQYYKLLHSKTYERLLTELHADSEGLTPVQKKVVEQLWDQWKRVKNIPADLDHEM